MATDLTKLDALLAGIGRDRDWLSRIIGLPITADMDDETKRLVWGIIRTPEVGVVLARVRVAFPEAVITAVTGAATAPASK